MFLFYKINLKTGHRSTNWNCIYYIGNPVFNLCSGTQTSKGIFKNDGMKVGGPVGLTMINHFSVTEKWNGGGVNLTLNMSDAIAGSKLFLL